MPAYVFPANAAQRRDETHVGGGDELGLWDAFRRYAEGPDVRLLRYVGLRLQRKEPPSLDVRDVFVMPGVEVRRREGAEEMMAAAWLEHLRATPGLERPDAPLPWGHLCDAMDMAGSRSFEEVFREHRSLIVLGDPGSGKTTLLRWLAVSAAGGLLTLAALGVAERLLPLPLSVGQLVEVRRAMGTSALVVDAMARYFHGRNLGEEPALRSFLQERLNARQCLVLLDGLDEMRNEERREMLSWTETFASAHAGNRFVASSRRVGYAGLILPDSEELVLRPFSDEQQIERYVRAFHLAYQRWELGGEDPSGAEKESERFLETLKGSPRLGGLDRNPFLLSALVLIHRAEGRPTTPEQ